MSWRAHLVDDRGHDESDWGYTHNCNGMANAVLEEDPDFEIPWDDTLVHRLDRETGEWQHNVPWGPMTWWKILDGMDGPAGAALLKRIADGLAADPGRFRAMNPENGWGNYDEFLGVLRDMMSSVPEWPCTWLVHG